MEKKMQEKGNIFKYLKLRTSCTPGDRRFQNNLWLGKKNGYRNYYFSDMYAVKNQG